MPAPPPRPSPGAAGTVPAVSVPPLRHQARARSSPPWRSCTHRIEEAFRAAAAGLSGIEAMAAMGEAYKELLGERDLLLVQLHAYAASRTRRSAGRRARASATCGRWSRELTGLHEEWIRRFFAQGMLMNVLAAFDAAAARRVLGPGLPARPRALLRIRPLCPAPEEPDPCPPRGDRRRQRRK